MTFDIALTLASAVFLLMMKPGPGMLAILSRTLSDGFSAGLFLVMGVATIEVFYFCLAILGFAYLENELLFFSILIKTMGAVYLLYVGVKGLINLDAGLWKRAQEQNKIESFFENYLSGVALTLSNPLVILFYAAIIPTLINLKALQTSDVILGAMIVGGINLIVLTGQVLLANHVRKTLKNERIVKIINLSVSLIFIGIGILLGLSIFPILDFSIFFQ